MFQKATKRQSKLRLGIAGPSGSGKTYSALLVAQGLGGKIAVIDTERGSASLYSDEFDFDVCEIVPPYTPRKYEDAINAAERAGYDVLIIDSLSHAWAGEGGLLEQVDDSGGGKFQAWAGATKQQNRLMGRIMSAGVHVIVTLRSKQAYALEVDSRGKQQVKKMGMAVVQRDGVEYELTTVLSIGMDHVADTGAAGKDRTGLFADPRILSKADGEALKAWLETGASREEPRAVQNEQREHHPSWDADRARFMQALGETGLDYEKQVKPWALSVGAGKPSTWPQEDRVRLINDLKSGKVRIS